MLVNCNCYKYLFNRKITTVVWGGYRNSTEISLASVEYQQLPCSREWREYSTTVMDRTKEKAAINYFQFFFTSHFGGWFGGHSKVVKHPNPSQILKGCLSSLLTSLAELICIYTWIFNISWKILLTLHFDLHFGLH